MKLKIILSILCVGVSKINGAAYPAAAGAGAGKDEKSQPAKPIDIKKYRAELLKKYTIADLSRICGPGIKATQMPPYYDKSGALSTLDGAVACFMYGRKTMYMGHVQTISPELEQLMKEENIAYFLLGDNMVAFTPEGRTNALLFAKDHVTQKGNAYIIGELLGYTNNDIYAFYLSIGAEKTFENDRRQALDWIKKSTPDIEQWWHNYQQKTKEAVDLVSSSFNRMLKGLSALNRIDGQDQIIDAVKNALKDFETSAKSTYFEHYRTKTDSAQKKIHRMMLLFDFAFNHIHKLILEFPALLEKSPVPNYAYSNFIITWQNILRRLDGLDIRPPIPNLSYKAIQTKLDVMNDQKIAIVNKIADAQRALLVEYQSGDYKNIPFKQLCRPGKRAEGVKQTILTNPRGVLACILAGETQVHWVGISPKKLQEDLGDDLMHVMQLRNISYMPDLGIMYQESTQEQALLLYKALAYKKFKTRNSYNAYLVSRLSGVSDEDIKADYGQEIKAYDADKQEALDWIEKNKPTIKQWAHEHRVVVK